MTYRRTTSDRSGKSYVAHEPAVFLYPDRIFSPFPAHISRAHACHEGQYGVVHETKSYARMFGHPPGVCVVQDGGKE